ncbi:MAG: glycosyltransferase family 4 protein [Muribaculum sp.]|nr:glycosyltransferase family 4 protein [Muribaculum sp.]
MKHLVIEAYSMEFPFSGVKEFMMHLGRGLVRRNNELRRHDIKLSFIVTPQHKGCFGNDANYIVMPRSLRFLLRRFYFPKVNLLYTPHQYSHLKNLPFVGKRLVTIHDINFIYTKTGRGYRRGIKRMKKRLRINDYLAFVSKFSMDDFDRNFTVDKPQRVIYNGVTDLTHADATVSDEFKARLPRKYFFHLSRLDANKNIRALAEMMKLLPEYNIVIAGNWDYDPELLARINAGEYPNIVPLHQISESEKAYLYKYCRAFMFPSLTEGFGLPPIEAMKCGKPVFLSTCTSLPEVGGDAAFYWPDFSPEAMADVVHRGMHTIDTDPTLTSRILANADRFTWEKCVDGYIDYFLSILESK